MMIVARAPAQALQSGDAEPSGKYGGCRIDSGIKEYCDGA